MRKLLRFLTSLLPRKQPCGAINHEYWQDQYGNFAQNVCTVLRFALLPVTRRNVMAFAATLALSKADLRCPKWRSRFCYRCMKRMYKGTKGTTRKEECYDLAWYFADNFVNRSDYYKARLRDTLPGVFDGLSLDRTSELYQRIVRTHKRSSQN